MTLISVPDEHKKQTDIRLKLLAQGYRPLPTAEKVAFMKGWPDMPVNERVISNWPMMGPGMRPAVTTAIQIEGTMLAIDVDTDGHADDVQDILYSVIGEDAFLALPIRVSGKHSFMALMRTETPYRMWKTPKYLDEDGDDHMVEVYGGASTRYFSCYGPHTYGGIERGKYRVLRSYEWLGADTSSSPIDPLTMRPEELPLITKNQLETFLRKVNDFFETQPGLTKVKGTLGGEFEGGVAYDLTPDMVFDTNRGETLSYDEAIAFALSDSDARCSSSFLDGESENRSKCRMRTVGTVNDGCELSVFDHETWTHHYPVSWAPLSDEERSTQAEALGEALRAAFPDEVQKNLEEAEEQGARTEDFRDAVEYMLGHLAYDIVTGSIHYLHDRSLIWNHVSHGTVKGAYAHLDLSWTGPRGGARRYSPVDAWRAFDDKLKVAGVRFNARTSERTYGVGHLCYANGFFGLPDPPDDPDQKAISVMHAFLEHLIPEREEREWFLDWLADKYQRPWQRNCAVVFIAPGLQGAGRGTLFRILDEVFDGYTMPTSESDLLSARFNDFMENNLIVFCNEMGGARWADRKAGYETLKDRVDPSHDQVRVEHKGLKAYRTTTYTSFILATNQPGALTIDAEDRRFAVLTNGNKLEGRLLFDMLQIGFNELAVALRAMVAHRKVTRILSDAPAFKGREAMLAANETDLDAAIKSIIDEADEDRAWLRSDFEKAVRMRLTGSSNGHVPGLRSAVSKMVGKRAERYGAELTERMRVGDKMVVALLAKSATRIQEMTPEERAEACKIRNV